MLKSTVWCSPHKSCTYLAGNPVFQFTGHVFMFVENVNEIRENSIHFNIPICQLRIHSHCIIVKHSLFSFHGCNHAREQFCFCYVLISWPQWKNVKYFTLQHADGRWKNLTTNEFADNRTNILDYVLQKILSFPTGLHQTLFRRSWKSI